MATFVDLYSTLLDRELGSVDATQRFTTARRKAAINQAVQEWNRLTESYVVEATKAVVDNDQEFDLETIITADAFMKLASRQPYIKIVTASTTTYIDGKSFARKDIETLDREEPGWRGASASRPRNWYLRDDGTSVFFGMHPKADVLAGETWTLVIPYVAYVADMTADADIPFNSKQSLRVYHQALVHFAAAQLEKLRRNYQVSSAQLDAFLAYVHDYLGARKSNAGDQVEFATNYFSNASIRGDRDPDPLRDD